MRGLFVACLLLITACATGDGPEQTYVSCRCCCKERGSDLPATCLYHSQNQNMADIIQKDNEWRKTPESACPAANGCTQAVLYHYCDEAPPAREWTP